MSQTRSVWAKAFRSLLTSLKPRQVRGNFMGKDYFGTKYFEIPAGNLNGLIYEIFTFEPMFFTNTG